MLSLGALPDGPESLIPFPSLEESSMHPEVRRAYWAGRFYPGDRDALASAVDELLDVPVTPSPAIGLMAPHAGYPYSGSTAGRTFASAEIPRHVILLGPNHTGLGAPAAIWPQGAWSLPTGEVPIAEDLADRICRAVPTLQIDHAAHLQEHSLEVQLPFLLARQADLHIVPVSLGGHWTFDRCSAVGRQLAQAVDAFGEPVLIVASSDLHHQGQEDLPQGRLTEQVVREKDTLALGRLEALDARGLLKTCRDERISMCGVVPTTVMLEAALVLGARRMRLIEHTDSFAVAGHDRSWVVGYAGCCVGLE